MLFDVAFLAVGSLKKPAAIFWNRLFERLIRLGVSQFATDNTEQPWL
jgi:hypothetical protein